MKKYLAAGFLAALYLCQPVIAEQTFFVTSPDSLTHRLLRSAKTCEFKDTVLVLADSVQVPDRLNVPGFPRGRVVSDKLSEPVIGISRSAESPLDEFEDRLIVLHKDGPITVFQTLPSVMKRLNDRRSNHFEIISFDEGARLHIPATRAFGGGRTPESALSESMAESVDIEAMMSTIKTLENFKTRYTYGTEFVDSAKWCRKQFEDLGYKAELVEYSDSGRKQFNVVAVSENADENTPFFVIGAHLDSTSENARVLAPGADDNGSGCAGVIEMARVFAGTAYEKNLKFVLFGGEEVGLKGSSAYVRSQMSESDFKNIRGAVIFDMIGFDHKAPVSALLETRSSYESFIKVFADKAQIMGTPAISVSYRPFGSDHMPFLNKKIPTFLYIEDEYDFNPNYHKTTDVVGDVVPELVEAITKTTVAGLEELISGF